MREEYYIAAAHTTVTQIDIGQDALDRAMALSGSVLVRQLRDRKLQEVWSDAIDAEAIVTCYRQRAEFLCSACGAAEYDEIAEMFADLLSLQGKGTALAGSVLVHP